MGVRVTHATAGDCADFRIQWAGMTGAASATNALVSHLPGEFWL